jgi:hypothetical protein
MKKATILALAIISALNIFAANPSEITVKIDLAHTSYVSGERIRAVVDVANASADAIDVGKVDSPDALILELFRASDRYQYGKQSNKPFVVPFALLSGEGQKLETFIADYFPFADDTRYLVRAVLIHKGMRFESAYKSFDIVPGMRLARAIQMFASRPELTRRFELVHWSRNQVEHIFLKVNDSGSSVRRWRTTDLGPILRVTPPKISVLKTGEIIVLHRTTQDAFIRSEFWSMPDVFEFHEKELMADPDIAGAERVKALYKEAGGVEPVKKAWWKFW